MRYCSASQQLSLAHLSGKRAEGSGDTGAFPFASLIGIWKRRLLRNRQPNKTEARRAKKEKAAKNSSALHEIQQEKCNDDLDRVTAGRAEDEAKHTKLHKGQHSAIRCPGDSQREHQDCWRERAPYAGNRDQQIAEDHGAEDRQEFVVHAQTPTLLRGQDDACCTQHQG